jgi:hypothetical protein
LKQFLLLFQQFLFKMVKFFGIHYREHLPPFVQ